MDWNSIGQSIVAWIFIGIWVWLIVGLIVETIIKKRDAAKLAEKDAIIWQLEQDRLYHSDTRRELIWVRDEYEWEKSRRIAAQDRADDLFKQLMATYGRVRASSQDSNEGGAPAQMVAA